MDFTQDPAFDDMLERVRLRATYGFVNGWGARRVARVDVLHDEYAKRRGIEDWAQVVYDLQTLCMINMLSYSKRSSTFTLDVAA